MKAFKNEFRLTADRFDKWGSAMAHLFEIAEELHFRGQGNEVPAHWEYSQGLGDCREDAQYGYEQETTCDLIQFGNLLERYIRILDKMGHSY